MPDQPDIWQDPFTASSDTTGNQSDPSIVQLADGRILVAWTTDNDTTAASNGLDIGGRMFDPLADPLGDDFQVNAAGVGWYADDEYDGNLAALPDGGYLLVLVDDETGLGGDPDNIRILHYDSTGAYVSAGTIQTDGEAGLPNYFDPQVAVSSATSALIVHVQQTTAGNADLYFTVYNPTTDSIVTGPTVALDNFDTVLVEPDLAVLANGNYVMTAASNGDVLVRGLDPTGANVISAVYVNGANDGFTDSEASIAGLAGGGYVVSWTSVNDGTGDTDIRYRVFDNSGIPVTSALTARGSGFNNCGDSEVVGLTDGNFVIVYADYDANVLYADHFLDDGTRIGRVAFADISADVEGIEAISLADGRFAVTWHESGGEVQTAILDTRDTPNETSVYTPEGYTIGTAGDDDFTTDVASNHVYGYRGDDVIHENGITKNYYGGRGDDLIYVNSGINSDEHYGGPGNDTIDWTGNTFDPDPVFDLRAETAFNGFSTEVMVGFENLVGTIFDDEIYGDGQDNVLSGHDGKDIVKGRGGDDAVFGNAGGDTLFGGKGKDTLDGGSGGDDLRGGGASDTLKGKAGSDTLNGNKGNDVLIGGGASDTFVFANAFGRDTIEDFDANDGAEDIDLSGVASITTYTDLTKNHMYQLGSDVVIDDLAGNTITIEDVSIADLNKADFLF